MSITKLTPKLGDLYETLQKTLKEIKSSERVQIIIPREYSHDEDDHDWDTLEELQMDCRGSILNPNVFVTFRFDQNKGSSEVIVDVCHFASK